MTETEILFETRWLQVLKLRDEEHGVHGYICTHAPWTNGNAVAVLPHRRIQPHAPIIGGEHTEFLLLHEVTPCWSMAPSISSITGGMDKEGESALKCAMRELHEEAGYLCPDELRWTDLGSCRLSKASTTVMHLFAVDLTDYEQGDAPGDGSEIEERAYVEWSRFPEKAEDALIGTMVFKLERMGRE